MYMDVKIKLNGKLIIDSVDQDMVLLDFCRKHNCFSVKRGCESGNCGLCTVLLDGKPVLSCSMPIGRADGRAVDTLEGLEEEAKQFTGFFAAQGADQCGFCNPGYIVNIVALLRENPDPTDEEVLEYLSGNLCRCTGYQSQLRSIRNFLNSKKEGAPLNLEAGVYGEDIGRGNNSAADEGEAAPLEKSGTCGHRLFTAYGIAKPALQPCKRSIGDHATAQADGERAERAGHRALAALA